MVQASVHDLRCAWATYEPREVPFLFGHKAAPSAKEGIASLHIPLESMWDTAEKPLMQAGPQLGRLQLLR